MALPKEKKPPVFMLYDWDFSMPPPIISAALTFFPEFDGGFASIDSAEEAIKQSLVELCPKGDKVDLKAFNDWEHDKKTKLISVLTRALLTGLFVYPRRKDGRPHTVSEAETSKATH
jgi:hypothetical protein